MVSSSICGSCAAHSAWMLAVAPTCAKRGTSSGCTTCRWARWCRPSVGPFASRAACQRVERVAHGAVAEGVEVHLEARGVEARDVLLQAHRVDEVEAVVLGLAAAAVLVRLEHRGGEVLGDAVEHDLHAGRAEPADDRRCRAGRGGR